MAANATGEARTSPLRLQFDRSVKLAFHGSSISSDRGLLLHRELDDALGLTDMMTELIADPRTGRNGRHQLVGFLRQSIFSRLAGYEDVNGADRLRLDPVMRQVVGGRAVKHCAVSASAMGRFETEMLTRRENLAALTDLLEAEGWDYAIRVKGNTKLHEQVGWMMKRRPGRPPNHVVREYTSFHYRARSWSKARRVVAKVEFHPGELFPRVGFIVTNRSRPNERLLAFYNQRGTAEQHIKEGKYALKWTRLSCMRFAANAVRLQLHALAYNLANFLRTLATPEGIETWSLTSLRERLIKTGARLVRHARYAVFQFAATALPRSVFAGILGRINGLRGPPAGAVSA